MPAAPKPAPKKKPAVAAPPVEMPPPAPVLARTASVVAVEPVAEPVAEADIEEAVDETVNLFAEAFSALALSIPPSVRKRIAAAIEKKGSDAAAETDDIKLSLEKAQQVYAAKKSKARIASKVRRDRVRAEKIATAAAEPDATSEVEPVVEATQV